MKLIVSLLGVMLLVLSSGNSQATNAPDRQVALTFDDLPAAAARNMSAADITAMTAKLVATLRDEKVPAVGFVNASKLYKIGEVDQRIKALQMWLDSGFELGNHTFSHASLNRLGLKAWEDDVIQGEPVLKLLLAQHNMKLRYLRHPYLDMGQDIQTRREGEAFLSARGYTIAPVTLDAWDWMFAPVYADAKKRGDAALQQKVVNSYLSYSDAVFAYCEQLSVKTLGYEPKQVLLLHGNQLEADHVAELLDLLRKHGYRFISLQEALTDPAYGLPDTYVGEEGMGWIEHWAITQGKPHQGAPVFPKWVMDLSEPLHQAQP
jgi:peptidoglycan/xylan/chitin deacetylase (PgdA/CDA1 family)